MFKNELNVISLSSFLGETYGIPGINVTSSLLTTILSFHKPTNLFLKSFDPFIVKKLFINTFPYFFFV